MNFRTMAIEARASLQMRKNMEGRGHAKFDVDTCAICLESMSAPATLPCCHSYCTGCLIRVRETQRQKPSCPMCRADLPPDPDRLQSMAQEAYIRVAKGAERRGAAAWSRSSLSKNDREDMDDVVAMLTEASEQGHVTAQCCLADILANGEGVPKEATRAVRLYKQAAEKGSSYAMNSLGILMLQAVPPDVDGAESQFRAAVAVRPDFADAHTNLAVLLMRFRNEFENAEAACRAAIQAEPSHAIAHYHLGKVLETSSNVDLDAAETAFRRAIEVNPKYSKAHCGLGQVLLRLGRARADSAGRALRTAIDLDAYDADAHNGLRLLMQYEQDM